MHTINNFDFSQKRALIRVDFNVPLKENFEISDDSRIRAAIPTIKHVIKRGGSVILMSHLGRPKNGPEEKFSLKHLTNRIAELTGASVDFAENCIGDEAVEKSKKLKPGNILLLENLRFHDEETKGEVAFAEKLAQLGDVYINDAFGTAHREHASTAVIARFFKNNCMFGLLMQREIDSVEQVMQNPQKPFTAVIGGAKVSSKIGIIENLLNKLDNLIIGGGMAYTFIKAQGGDVGDSLVEEEHLETAKKVMKAADKKGVRILLPEDSAVANTFSNEAAKKIVDSNDIPSGWMGLDIGPRAMGHNTLCLEESKTILWNGPMGVFEFDNFAEGTKSAAFAIVSATERGAYSLVGGGDSVAAVNKFNIQEHVSYVSTGGGALLELIEGKKLPGIVTIEKANE